MKFKSIFVVSTMTLVVSTVCAANWKAVEGTDAYVDMDSKRRAGDIASIDVRIGDSRLWWEFDCERWRYLDKDNTQIKPNTLGNDVALIACKRKWEIWK